MPTSHEDDEAVVGLDKFQPDDSSMYVSAKEVVDEAEKRPDMDDPAWHDYVMRQFSEAELDQQGAPFVHGLRRVARKLLGPIGASRARVVQSPTFIPGLPRSLLTPAVVEYEVSFHWEVDDALEGAIVTFSDAADCWEGNTDYDYAKHPTATAATKAEGRAYRKALGLGRIVAAEEKTVVRTDESNVDGKIGRHDVTWLDCICRRNDINVMGLINATRKENKYISIMDVPAHDARKVIEFVSEIQNNPEKYAKVKKQHPTAFGYADNWQEEQK